MSAIFMDKEKIKNDMTVVRRKRVSVVILKDGKVLFLRRVKPDREYFVIPGGGVENGESIEEALVREVKEELTLEVKKYRFLFSIENVPRSSVTAIRAGSQDEYYFLIEEYS
jgi:ADP-ribose pyrophosphatase YjhB (NUDIX family)